MSSPAPAAPAAPTPGPAGDADETWLNADRIFLGLLVVSLPAAIASLFLFPGTWTFILCAMEVLGMGLGVGAATLIALDGESNWLEGVMLLGVSAVLSVTLFIP